MSIRTVTPKKWASSYRNGKLITIETWSGYARQVGDPAGPHYDFAPDESDGSLGSAVLDCLAHSRFLDTAELRAELFHPEALSRSYAAWIERLMLRSGSKSKRALLKDMQCCEIEQESDTITIRPTHHEKLDGWSGEGFIDVDNVVISAKEPPAVIGAALREAFRRCT